MAGAQAIDTTLVSPLRRWDCEVGTRQTHGSGSGGSATQERDHEPRVWERRTSLSGGVAQETGSRWSVETTQFLRSLANAKAESVLLLMQNRVKVAWLRRWSSILACSAGRAFALAILDRRSIFGSGASVPSGHEVVRDDLLLTSRTVRVASVNL